MRKLTATALAISAVGTALAAGSRYSPGPKRPATRLWYASLRKPAFIPPKPAYGVVWGVLSIALVYSGYRLMIAPPARQRSRALFGWTLNVVGLCAWPWLFFGRKQLRASVALAAGMCVAAVAYVRDAAAVDHRAALASVPYVGWLFFALAIDEEVARRNTGSPRSLGDAMRRPALAMAARLARR